MAKSKASPRSKIRRQTEEFYNQNFGPQTGAAVTADTAVVDTQPLPMDSADLSASPFRLLGNSSGPVPVQTTQYDGEGGAVQQTAGDCRTTGTCEIGGTTGKNLLYATQELPEYSPPTVSTPVTASVQPEPEPVVVDAQPAYGPQEAVTPEETVPGNVDGMVDPTDVDAEVGQDPLAAEISRMTVDQKLITLQEEDANPDSPAIKQQVAEQGAIDTQAMLGELQAKLDYNVSYLAQLNSLPTTTRNQINQINMVQDDIQRNMTMYMGVLAQQIDFQSAMNLQVQYQNSPLGMAQASSLLAEAQARQAEATRTIALLPGEMRNQELQNKQLASVADPVVIDQERAAITNSLVLHAGKGNLIGINEAKARLYEHRRAVAASQLSPTIEAEAISGAGEREQSAAGAAQGQPQVRPVGVAETELVQIRNEVDDAVIAATIDAVYAPIDELLKNPNVVSVFGKDKEAARELTVNALIATVDTSVNVMVKSMIDSMTPEERADITNPAKASKFIGSIQTRVEAALQMKEMARVKEVAGTGRVDQIKGRLGMMTGDKTISDLVRQSVIKRLESMQAKEPQSYFFGGGMNQIKRATELPNATGVPVGTPNY